MRLCPAVAVVLSVVLIATVGGSVVVAESDDDPGIPLEPADPQQVIQLNVTDSGDVEWHISHQFLLSTDEEIEEFDRYAESVRAGDRPVDYDLSDFERFLTLAQTTTDRPMEITDAGWEEPRVVAGETENESIGVLTYSFTWTGFAEADGTRIHFGSVFYTPQGSWFSTLLEGQELVIKPPDSYAFEDAPPTQTRNGALVWQGPHTFSDGELEMVLIRTGQVLGMNPILAAGAGIMIVIVALVSYVLIRRLTTTQLPDRAWVQSVLGRLSDRSAPSDAPDGAVVDYDEADIIDDDLLSDEERVHRMLATNGGRMKQATIVKETGWSNAKVSQLLSKMDDDEEINKLRIGRENLITLPEVDPTEAD